MALALGTTGHCAANEQTKPSQASPMPSLSESTGGITGPPTQASPVPSASASAWSAFAVVHEAERLAHRLGEPRGTLLLTLTITGLEQGAIYALIALGYTMVYGVVELINFAHGEFLMLGCDTTQMLTGIWNHPDKLGRIPQVLAELETYMAEIGVSSIAELKGRALELITNFGELLKLDGGSREGLDGSAE